MKLCPEYQQIEIYEMLILIVVYLVLGNFKIRRQYP
jgi:hypothetical protein